ncbi:hypothetical protein TH53_18480 [Pedobacter lusitanus]|uniref:Contig81, whole genome shotgun sequence n=1 Tax=Pedobacter lusitanus TaxID=1503925 RepID=A0A0D0GI71_9SPHI|nr:neuraminidase-like domain-containing protein [Pedobacter lusitanus]KIO75805.1 hypothetical protein TH53_18480 [Pedobacter lusitanus]
MATLNQAINIVFGKIRNQSNQPLPNLLVQAYDRDMRSEELLGECITAQDGSYEISWKHEQLSGRGRKEADLSMKVLTREKKTVLYASAIIDTRFNAAASEEINIIIKGKIPAEFIEYDYLYKEVGFLAGKVKQVDLQENEQHQDISFLSGEMNVPAEKIVHLVVAQRLQELAKIDAPFFYALLRKNTLLKNDLINSFQIRTAVDLHTELLPLLYDAALCDPKIIKQDITAAVKEKLIAEKVGKEAGRYQEILQQYKTRAEEYYQQEYAGKVFLLLKKYVLDSRLSEIGQIFKNNRNNLDGLISELTARSFFESSGHSIDAKTAIKLAELIGFNVNLIERVKKAENINTPAAVKDLAALNKADWRAILAKQPGVKDQGAEKEMLDIQASALARKFEKEYPAVAFRAQLDRAKTTPYKNQAKIREFFKTQTGFDLQYSNIDLLFKERKMSNAANDPLRNELKAMQRVFKLVPHYSKTNALLAQHIHSAQSITLAGKSRFVNDIAPKAGISPAEAKAIYNRAETASTAAMLLAGELHDTISAMDIPAMEMKTLSLKIDAVSKDFPNLKSLFYTADVCTCEECRSVYSPAAYLVEILQFLQNRKVTDLSLPPANLSAKEVLFKRRPDLGDIDLGCENAMTPVPYIDLVCELLEEAITPDGGIPYTGVLSDGPDPLKGKISASLLNTLLAAKTSFTDPVTLVVTDTPCNFPVTSQALIFKTEGTLPDQPFYLRDQKVVFKAVPLGGSKYTIYRLRQTLSSAEELASSPAYVNVNAYKTLQTSFYAFKLPFDLNLTSAKAYFSRFGLDRAELMKAFQSASSPSDLAIAAEKLGLTDTEKDLIVTAASAKQQTYWNTTAANASAEMNNVDVFLTKSGLSFKELTVLLTLKFIDPDKKLFIKNLDLTCDTTKKIIDSLDDVALDRIHRFLRLQKKTGLKFELLDEFISQVSLGGGDLQEAILQIADLKRVSAASGLQLDELTGFFGQIPYEIRSEESPLPLFSQVFLNKSKNGFADEKLLADTILGTGLLSAYRDSLSVCLQLSGDDFDQLTSFTPDGKLNFKNLSTLYAIARLMKKLGLKRPDFEIISELTGLIFSAAPAVLLQFVTQAMAFRAYPQRPADLLFMLKHEAADLVNREMKETRIIEVLTGLQQDLKKVLTDNQSLYNDGLETDEQREALQNQLAKLTNVEPDTVKVLMGFLDALWVTPAAAKTFADDHLAYLDKAAGIKREGLDTTDLKNKIDDLAAASPANFATVQKTLLKSYFDTLSVYFITAGKKTVLVQCIMQVFKSSEDLAKVILDNALLRQPAPGTAAISDLLSADSFINLLVPVTSLNCAGQFSALRLLHQMIPLINSFQLEITDTAWYFKNAGSLGWFLFDGIPYDSTLNPVNLSLYADFVSLTGLAKSLSPVPDPADAENPLSFTRAMELLLPGNTTTQTQWMETMALLTGYQTADLTAIDARLFTVFNLDNYKNPQTWQTVMTNAAYLRTLGATVSQVVAFIKPVLTATDTTQLRMALKARYDENTWSDTLKEITDAIRPQKRDALIAYLLAVNPDLKDENDLYDYFLVDVEMEAVISSSRIVQAHNTVQLFVQRCLMGLEPESAANLDDDPNWNQWKWMKNYRVWEANRKVFLYPENWIEAELRDDKSFMFKELENELLQDDLNNDTAEAGLINYLEKLDNIAFLEVVATWYQIDIRTMHVFGRTKGGDPAIYYYRRFEQERYWSPWEKVELDITSDQLLAFMRNNRLCLAWPVFSEEAEMKDSIAVPSGSGGGTVPGKPNKKLKIQLAVSEFANGKWQPKKISKDAIESPSGDNYTLNTISRDLFNMMYFEFLDQIWLFTTNGYSTLEQRLEGVFNVTGCKGYPELVKGFTPKNLADFYPDFENTSLRLQRYNEMSENAPEMDRLAVKNAFSMKDFMELLGQTPGTFRLTYPAQFSYIDMLVMLFELIFMGINSNYASDHIAGRQGRFKGVMGTLMPYFMEDSYHAYVIVPGFYNTNTKDDTGPLLLQRTIADVLQLIDDIIALGKKYMAKLKAVPAPDPVELVKELNKDEEFQRIKTEIDHYQELAYGEAFKNMYHPLVCPLKKSLYKLGIPELMKRETQLQQSKFDFQLNYKPNVAKIPKTYLLEKNGVRKLSFPVEDLDFSSDGSYSEYNWELFFHIPFLLAGRLSQNQQFEDALTWFHYMFNPTGALAGKAPEKYWVTKPFFLTHEADYTSQRIDNLMFKVAHFSTEDVSKLEFAIAQWREKPFQPHVIARFRPVAYQKALLMKYIGNLTAWGDYLFRQDTMESIAQATQMYILADKLLGPKPRVIKPVVKAPYETYNQLEANIDAFGNALVNLENILPDLSVLPEGGAELPPPDVTLSMLYFCIPNNDQMNTYWDQVADRLFKIRNSQNIDGVFRSLALFAPPIDPGMLVRAAASGMDISSILAGMNAPTPFYRFNVLSQKAGELTQEVRGLGSSLLQALEKKDAESMALLRSELEIRVLNAVKDMKTLQISEAKEQIQVLEKTKLVTEARHNYYRDISYISSKEQLNLDKLSESHDYQMASQILGATAGILALIPDLDIGASGFGGSPLAAVKWGGSFLAHSANAAAGVLNVLSSAASYEANRAATAGSYDRRFADWKLQETLAGKELDSLDKQISAAQIRQEIAETDLRNHLIQIDNAKKTDDFMHTKFTNKQLYDWMIGQVSAVYFRAYSLAHDFAKKAERSYQYELGNGDSYIQYGYWDSMKKGLQSADQLLHDIKRMECGYLDKNKREYELTRHVSVSLLDPLALVQLRATGVCDFDIPEALYDMDYAGQYFRRIKSVSISLPCIAGPHTAVSAKLSLVKNKYRKNMNHENAAGTGYTEDPAGNDERFIFNVGSIQSIAASSAQNDSGVFELNFKDERYLPFEGTGAISSWRLELPEEVRQFDYSTIADVVLHVKYTAREGGSVLKGLAEASLKDRLNAMHQTLNETGLHIGINLKQDMPDVWNLLLKNASAPLTITKFRLPYFVQPLTAVISKVIFVAKVKGDPGSYTIKIDGTDLNLSKSSGLLKAENTTIQLDTEFILSGTAIQIAKLDELVMVVKYGV